MEERTRARAGGSSVMLWRDTVEGRRCGAQEEWRRGGSAALERNRGRAAAGAREGQRGGDAVLGTWEGRRGGG
jgi:hypothetical protein